MKNLTEYITEAGFDSHAQIRKNKEIINKYFSDFTISAPTPIKRQKNYEKYFDYIYRCEISKKEEIEPFYKALCKMYDETGQKYNKESIDRQMEFDKKQFGANLELNKKFSDSFGIPMDSMPVASIPFCIQTKPDLNK